MVSSRRSARLLRMVGALIAGLCLWLAFPSHNLWYLPPVAVAIFAAVTQGVRARFGFLLGLICGLAFFIPTLKWSGTYVGVVPWIALAILQALYIGALGAAIAYVQRRRVAPWLGAALWMTDEWLRSTTPFGGFPWARLAFSQANAPWLPAVAWISSPGLTFLIALVGSAVAALIVPHLTRAFASQPATAWTDDEGGFFSRRFVSGLSALACALVLFLIGAMLTPPTSGPEARIAAVQGNVPTAGLDFNAQRRAVLDNHVRTTLALAQQVKNHRAPQPDVVIWPENSSDIDPEQNPDAGTEIMNAVDTMKAPVIVGAVLAQPLPKVSNASLLYEPNRGVVDTYVKQHPVPFGEYIPYRSFFRNFSHKVDLVRADFEAGKKVGVFTVPAAAHTGGTRSLKIAPIICFEVAYDDLMRKPAERGAQIFAVQTNNATFGYSDESAQQLAISRIRAVEYSKSVVHISTVGISALITPDGVAHDVSRPFTAKALQAALPLRTEKTLADRMGRLPEILGALLSLGGLIVAGALRPRTRLRRATKGDAS